MHASIMQKMSLKTRLSTLFLAGAMIASAATVTFNGPTLLDGTPCNAGDIGCIIGAPTSYEVFQVSLTQPTGGNPNWTLQIQTNYPSPITTPTSVIPPSPWHDGLLYSIPDFIFKWNGTDYGIVLAPHVQAGVTDAFYSAGNLYQAPNVSPDIISSGSALSPSNSSTPPAPSPRPTGDVWLADGGTLLGNGSITVTQLGNGTSQASYLITDSFSAPADFLSSGTFTIEASSYPCDNGVLVASGEFTTTGVPEPGTFMLAAPALLFVGRLLRRRSS